MKMKLQNIFFFLFCFSCPWVNIWLGHPFSRNIFGGQSQGICHPQPNFAAYCCRMLQRSLLDAAHSSWFENKAYKSYHPFCPSFIVTDNACLFLWYVEIKKNTNIEYAISSCLGRLTLSLEQFAPFIFRSIQANGFCFEVVTYDLI